MPKRVWDKYISERDHEVFDSAGFGQEAGLGQRPVLMVVDVNYAFCGEKPEPILESVKTWKLSCGMAAWEAMPVLNKLIETSREKGIPVIYTTGYSRDDKWDRGGWSWKNPRGESLEKAEPKNHSNRDGNEIMEEIKPGNKDIVVYKQKPSAFHEAPTMSYLNLLGADSIIVTGTTTSGCVRATAVDAFSYNYRVGVVEDACFDRSDISHAVSLLDLHAKYADVLYSDKVLDYISKLPDNLFNLPSGVKVPT